MRWTTGLRRGFSISARLRHTGINPEEMTHFNALADLWWDVNGPQRILHKMNLLRMDFIYDTVRTHIKLNPPGTPEEDRVYVPPFGTDLLPPPIRNRINEEQDERRDDLLAANPLKVLDVGCGGGILAELMARLPFVELVKGIDLLPEVLAAAETHALGDPMLADKLQYTEAAVADVTGSYDVVTMFEMLEHVDYPAEVMSEALARVAPGGWLFLSTINRDFVLWFTTIFMGEHLLRIVPVGTHTLEKYINQEEIATWVAKKPEYRVVDARGCIYLPAYGWKFTDSPNVGNYFMAIQRTA